MDDPVFVEITVVCITPGCGNEGTPVVLVTVEDATAVCGVCGESPEVSQGGTVSVGESAAWSS